MPIDIPVRTSLFPRCLQHDDPFLLAMTHAMRLGTTAQKIQVYAETAARVKLASRCTQQLTYSRNIFSHFSFINKIKRKLMHKKILLRVKFQTFPYQLSYLMNVFDRLKIYYCPIYERNFISRSSRLFFPSIEFFCNDDNSVYASTVFRTFRFVF